MNARARIELRSKRSARAEARSLAESRELVILTELAVSDWLGFGQGFVGLASFEQAVRGHGLPAGPIALLTLPLGFFFHLGFHRTAANLRLKVRLLEGLGPVNVVLQNALIVAVDLDPG